MEPEFLDMYSENMRSNEQKLQEGKFLIITSEEKVTMSMAKYWKKIPRQVVKSSTLEIFKTCLDKVPQQPKFNVGSNFKADPA